MLVLQMEGESNCTWKQLCIRNNGLSLAEITFGLVCFCNHKRNNALFIRKMKFGLSFIDWRYTISKTKSTTRGHTGEIFENNIKIPTNNMIRRTLMVNIKLNIEQTQITTNTNGMLLFFLERGKTNRLENQSISLTLFLLSWEIFFNGTSVPYPFNSFISSSVHYTLDRYLFLKLKRNI